MASVDETRPCWTEQELSSAQERLLNVCAATLIHEPRYYEEADERKLALIGLVVDVATNVGAADPQFVLKLALYVREELNVRSTANYLLALAAALPECALSFATYFHRVVKLPTDLLEVANMYVALPASVKAARGGSPRALPSMLRRAICKRLAAFSPYQLSKYCRSGRRGIKRRGRKADEEMAVAEAVAGVEREVAGLDNIVPEVAEAAIASAAVAAKPRQFSFRSLIRHVHASKPVETVAAILQVRYPASAEEFRARKMTGEWEASRAGKRMRLPVAETWETVLSVEGASTEVWERLVAEGNLPFTAMLRNLRNLINWGVSEETHASVIARLRDEEVVRKSRQLPMRFLSAYTALDAIDLNYLRQLSSGIAALPPVSIAGMSVLQSMGLSKFAAKRALYYTGNRDVAAAVDWYFMNLELPELDAPLAEWEADRFAERLGGAGRRPAAPGRRAGGATPIPKHVPTEKLLRDYRAALDAAMATTARHNLPRLKGRTVVFCDVSGSMDVNMSAGARGMGSVRTTMDLGLLLGLLIQYSSDECDFRIFSSPGDDSDGKCHVQVQLQDGSVLDNYHRARAAVSRLGGGTDFPFDYLEDLITHGRHVDRFIILSDMMIAPGHEEMNQGGPVTVSDILSRYRASVNPELRFVAMDLYGKGSSIVSMVEGEADPRDVLLTGFSDAVLRFISLDAGSQLAHVQAIAERRHVRPRGAFAAVVAAGAGGAEEGKEADEEAAAAAAAAGAVGAAADPAAAGGGGGGGGVGADDAAQAIVVEAVDVAIVAEGAD